MKNCSLLIVSISLITFHLSAAETVSCGKLSDSFCDNLWSATNLGNVTLSDNSKILQGATPSRLISNATYLYYKKIVANKCNLPADLREILLVDCNSESSNQDLLSQLGSHLALTLDPSYGQGRLQSSQWSRKFSDLTTSYNRAMEDTLTQRVRNSHPSLTDKRLRDYTEKEAGIYNDIKFVLLKEIQDAVYINSPEWAKVKSLFSKVQSEIIRVVDAMELDAESTARMKQRVTSVELTLPYEDPRLVGADSNCARNDMNAFYNSFHHKFTVCTGLLNTVSSEGFLFFLMAHEIAHSIDPSIFASGTFKSQSPVAKLVGEAYKTNGTINCSEWEKRKQEILEPVQFVFALPVPVENLTQCLVDRSRLTAFSEKDLDYAVARITESVMNQGASSQLFTLLSQRTIIEDGKEIENDIYLDPQALLARSTENLVIDYYSNGELNVGAVFVQDFKCQMQTPKTDELTAYEQAIDNTSKIVKAYYNNESRFLGQNSRNLVSFNLALPAGEDFSDWVAFQIYPAYLKSIDSIENRRNAVVAGQAIFCSPNGIEQLAKEKVVIERKWSRQAHPLQRKRRLRFFTPEVADLVQCERGQEVETMGAQCGTSVNRLTATP